MLATEHQFTSRANGSSDPDDLLNIAPQTSGCAFQWWGSDGNMVVDRSIGYRAI
jgi:hypothetical protein